jgi:hypothetical protein
MAQYLKKKGPDVGQNLRQFSVPLSEQEIARIDRFQVDVAMPGTPLSVVTRFLLVTGLEYLEKAKASGLTATVNGFVGRKSRSGRK